MWWLRASAYSISEDHKHSSALHISSVWLDSIYFSHYRSRLGYHTAPGTGTEKRVPVSLRSVVRHLGFVWWWKQLLRKTAGRRKGQMEKARSKSMRRKTMVILKWVSTRSLVEGTRAKLATDIKEQKPSELWLGGQNWWGKWLSKKGVGQVFEKKGKILLR